MNTRTRVAIYGAGFLGKQILHHLQAYYSDKIELQGFLDDTKPVGEEIASGLRCLGSLSDAIVTPKLSAAETRIVFAVGYASMMARKAALQRVLSSGYELFSVIHPSAIIEPNADVGPGSVVLGGAVLDQGVVLGRACFVDIGVRLGADTSVGENNYFSSGTSTGSRVSIGSDCFFGMDTTITTDVSLGSNLFINAKSLVPRDVGDNVKLVEVHRSKQLPISATQL